MWSYKYTSSGSAFTEQCRVGVRLEAATTAVRLVEVFAAAAKEQVYCDQVINIIWNDFRHSQQNQSSTRTTSYE